jgi:hypothetical protein
VTVVSHAGLVLIAFVAAVASAFARRGRPYSIHLWIVVAYPFIFALSPLAFWVGEGRYYFFLWPILAITLVDGLRSDLVRSLALIGFAALTWVGLAQIRTLPSRVFTNVAPMGQLEQLLADNNITRVVSGYWTGYKLAYQTDERVLVATTFVDRRPQWRQAVLESPEIVYVYPRSPGGNADQLATLAQQRMAAVGVPSRRVDLDDYTVLLPEGHVTPDQIGADALPFGAA